MSQHEISELEYCILSNVISDDSEAAKEAKKDKEEAEGAGNRTLEIEKKLEKGWADALLDNSSSSDDVEVEDAVNSVTPDTDLFLHSNGSEAAAQGEVRENQTDTELMDGMIEIDLSDIIDFLDDHEENENDKKVSGLDI